MTRDKLLQKAKPILFNTEMVRAILDGRKTVTRRVIKPQPKSNLCYTFAGGSCRTWGYPSPSAHEIWGDEYKLPKEITKEELKKRWNPPYHTDDILYVRETWHKYTKRVGKGENCRLQEFYGYKASIANSEDANEPWKPSIHMPKEAARIFLKVTAMRVERLQEMDEDDAFAEGVSPWNDRCYANNGWKPSLYDPDSGGACCPLDAFEDIWNSTIKESDIDRYGWDANPWVWGIEFERIEV